MQCYTTASLHTYCNIEEGKVYTAKDHFCTSQVTFTIKGICVCKTYAVITWFCNDPDAGIGRKMSAKATGDSSCHLFK